MTGLRINVLIASTLTLLLTVEGSATSLQVAKDHPAEAPTPSDVSANALEAAVSALKTEVESLRTAGDAADWPRKRSDYFPPAAAVNIEPADVVAALNRTHAGRDGAADAYVKWQLLSAVQGRFPDELRRDALKAYRAAPVPRPFPGLSTENKRELDDLARRLTSPDGSTPDLSELSEKYAELVRTNVRENTPILGYRDALIARLPTDAATLAAGFDDVAARENAGLATSDLVKTLSADARTWLVLGSPSSETLRSLASGLRRLAAQPRPRVYIEPRFEEKTRKVVWRTGVRGVDPKRLTELAEDLEAAARRRTP